MNRERAARVAVLLSLVVVSSVGIGVAFVGSAAAQSADAGTTEISDWNDLQGIGSQGDYVLVNDLNDTTDGYSTVVESGGFTPVFLFGGTLDGNGYVIEDLVIETAPELGGSGLFAQVGSGVEIRNVGVENVDIDVDGNNVGALVGTTDGSRGKVVISGSYATGTVKGNGDVGGLVGKANVETTITDSFADVDVTGDTNGRARGVGGLVGTNTGAVGDNGPATIQNSYATGDVTNQNDGSNAAAGGLAGDAQGSIITDSYATGAVEVAYEPQEEFDTAFEGGLVGRATNAEITDSYWDTDTTNRSSATGLDLLAEDLDAEGLTTSEMQGAGALDEAKMAALTDSKWKTVGEDNTLNVLPKDDGYPILTGIAAQPQLNAQEIAFDSPANAVLNVDSGESFDGDTPIQAAVDSADSGDTLRVGSGTYNESVTIDVEDLTLKTADGTEDEKPVIRYSPDAVSGDPTVKVSADGVRVSGFTINRVAADSREDSYDDPLGKFTQGVRVSGSDVEVSNNTVQGEGFADLANAGIMILDDESEDAGQGSGETIENVSITGNNVSGFAGGLALAKYYGGSIRVAEISGNDLTGNNVSGASIASNVDVEPDGYDYVAKFETDNQAVNPDWYFKDKQSALDFAAGDTGVDTTSEVVVEPSDGDDNTDIYHVGDGMSIQDAVNNASSGDTITVSAGTYNESMTIDTANVTLTSTAGADATTINTTSLSRSNIPEAGDNVTVDGFSFVFDKQAIYVRGDNVTIRNSTFGLAEGTESNGYAVRYEGLTSDGELHNNTFTGINVSEEGEFGNGVVISGPDGHKVTDNEFTSNSIGVNVGNTQPAANLLIRNNSFTSQDNFGVALNHDDSETPKITIEQNEFTANEQGVLVLANGSINVTENNLNDSGIDASSLSDTVNATFNYWGAADGPSGDFNGSGASATGNIEIQPFYTNAERTTPSEPANYTITITDLNASVGVGDTVVANYTVNNTGDLTATQDIDFLINGTNEGTNSNVTLDAGENTSSAFTYTTTADDAPAINVTVASANDTAQQNVTVDAQANFSVELSDLNETVTAGNAVVANYTVNNTGDVASTQNIDFLINGSEEATNESVILNSGENTSGEFTYTVTTEDRPVINVTVSSDNDTADQSVAVASPTATINGINSVSAGANEVTADIVFSNTANGNITVDVVDSNGNSIADSPTPASGNGSVTISLSSSVSDEEIDVVVYETDSTSNELASQTTTVPAPPEPEPDPEPTDPATFGVSVSTSNAATAGDSVAIDATIDNTGGQSGSQTITATAGGTEIGSQTVSLDAGGSETVSFSYTTTTADTPSVEITVESDDDSASSTVSVTEPAGAAFSLASVDTPGSVTASDSIDISATVDNTGGQSGSQTITATAGGSQIGSQTVSLDAGSSETVSFSYTTTTDDTPSVDIVLSLANESTTRTVSVTQPATPSFAVTALNTPTTVTAGDTITANATIENTGGASGTQPVTLLVDGSEEATETITLAGGETTTQAFSYAVSETATSQRVDVTVETLNATSSATIQINGTLDRTPLSLTANQTTLVSGQAIEFTVTDDSESPVSATVSVLGTAQETGADGTVVIPIDTPGQIEAVATKEQADTTEFAPATVDLTVSEPAVNLEQQTISFGDVAIGEPATSSLTIQNPAPTSISIESVGLTGSGADAFSIGTAELPDSVPANSDTTLNITFDPQTRGASQATLAINEQTATLNGTGTAPDLTIDSSLPIELTAEPGSTATTPVTVSNEGNVQLNATLSSGDRFTQPDTLTVDPGASEAFDVEFTPQDGDDTTLSTRLEFTPDNEAASTTTIPVVGTVRDRDISLQTGDVSLGNVTVGETTTGGVVVDNPGTTTETLTVTTDTDVFEVSDDDQITLAPGDQSFLSIDATPTEPGETTGSLTVETNNGAVSDTATLTATGQAPEVNIETAEPVSFSPTPLNSTTTQAVEISNDGDASLTITVDEALEDTPFSPVGDSQLQIPAGDSQTLQLGFTPQTAEETTTDLTFTTNDPETPQPSITLTGEGIQTNVGLTPSTVDFGAVGVSNSTTETVTLENEGSEFTIEDITADGSAFDTSADLAGTVVAEGESTDIPVVFDPDTNGGQTGTVTISGSTDTESTSVSAALTGTGQTATLQLSSQTLRTGVTVTDETTTGTISIENTGLAGTELTVDELSLNDTAQFSLSSDSVTEGTTISGQSGGELSVTFEPPVAEDGVEETDLTLAASSGDQTFTRTITVTGTVSAPEPTVSTTGLDVGTTSVGDTTSETVSISNDGGEPFSITDVETDTTGVTAQRSGSSEVVPGDERQIVVAVNRTASGRIDTTVDITTTTPDDFSVAVTGDVVAPSFSVDTESVTFSDTPTGSASSQTVTIENTGAAPLTVAEPTLSGPDAFSLISGDQRLRIPSGDSETITVGFAPETTGEQTATLSIEPRNDPTVDTAADITLSGTGTDSNVGLTESAIGFGTVQPDSTASRSITVANDGNAPVEITGSSVTGADSDAVSVNGLQQRILQSGDTESFNIELDTTGVDRGQRTAQVAINTDDTTVSSSVGATVASPALDIESALTSDDFGTTRVGQTSTARLQVENTGNADLDLTDLSTTGPDAAGFSVVDQPTGTISPQSSAGVTVEFNPAALNAPERAQNTQLSATASLSINSNAGSTETVSLSGTAETAALTAPQTFQFGETPIGETTTRQLTIENDPSATAPLSVTALTVSGSNADAYEARLADTEPPASLVPGESTTVNLSLTPTTEDRQFSTVTVETNDSRQPAVKIGVSNTETVYTVDYGSVDVEYINPTPGQEPTVDVDRGLRGQNATLTRTVSDVNTTRDYNLNYTFGDRPSAVGQTTALQEEQSNMTAVRYMNATTTAPAGEFNDSIFRMEVSKAVLAQQNATPENVTIYHETDTGYEPLETTRLFETTQGHVYEVTTDSYSVFAVGTATASSSDDGGDDSSDDGGDDGSGSSGGGGGGGVPPSATDGTGVDVPNITAELGESATIASEYEAITVQNEAVFPESFPHLTSVTFESGIFEEGVQATVNAREIEGEPMATGIPSGEPITITHLSVPNKTSDQMTIRYNLSTSRLNELGATPRELTLHQYADDEWQSLETTVVEGTERTVTVTTETANATTSYIAFSAPVSEQNVEQTDDGETNESIESTEPSTDDGTPGFGPLVALIAILGVTVLAKYRN